MEYLFIDQICWRKLLINPCQFLGCGEARIAQELGERFTVHSFDLVALNRHVTSCNITKTPLEDSSVGVVVYCLSLMGTNLGDFFREANRILKKG